VVLDATFLDPNQREGAAAVARRHHVPLVLVETVCGEATVAARLAVRAQRGNSLSDASLATYLRQLAVITDSPPPIPPGAIHVQIDTDGPLPISIEDVWASLARAELVLASVPCVRVDQSEGLPSAASLAGALPHCPPIAGLRACEHSVTN
jgi:hypothetical protein